MVHAHASQNSYGVQMKMRTPDDIPPIHLVPHTDTFNSMFCFNRFFFFWFVSSAFVSFTHSIVIRCSHYFLCIVILAIDFLSNLFCSVLFFVINASPRIVLINVSQVESIACRFLFHASICWLTEINHCWHAFFFISLFLKPIRSTFFCSIFVAKVGVKIRYFILGVGYSVSSLPGVCRPTKKRKERSFSNNFVFILFFWQKENVNYCYCCPNIFKPYVFGWMQSFYAYTLHRIQCRKLLIHFNAFDWK